MSRWGKTCFSAPGVYTSGACAWRTLERAGVGFSPYLARGLAPYLSPAPVALCQLAPAWKSAGKAFVWMDRYLDTTLVGPLFLRRPEAAAIVVQALQRGGAPPLLRPVVQQERGMERLVVYIENNPVKVGLLAERLERRSRPGLRAEARSGTLMRAPRAGSKWTNSGAGLKTAPRRPPYFSNTVSTGTRSTSPASRR